MPRYTPKKVSTVLDFEYTAEHREHIKIRRKLDDTYSYSWQRHTAKETFTRTTADFEIALDLDALVTKFVLRAAHSKSGRATGLNGMIVCKRRNVREGAKKETVFPVPEDF